MASNNFINLITKLSEALLTGSQKSEKSGYKPENASKTRQSPDGNPSSKGDFNYKSQTTVSPKQSVVEMLRRHDALSKKIDAENEK